ncbi:hypothetical protein EDM54_12900 [Brevibacillus borstelensis]|jgi:hypothetical protein|uniref:hypothetical protein n=1 Tax=Brevibacillus borstelensis TaxID=45462 RepID=UPI000F088259|nr:hypothetical protein [Brevibacillus borstelensis]MED1881195.1 hypothetical protein [Brevibacillus borstelensis]RNB62793.1 hypothetical protein EDM54_12900 [Brevibacillus borstelensis]GED55134.1 hypothetical protein BBO01nite_43750 [Brevibacillus borstelensis]
MKIRVFYDYHEGVLVPQKYMIGFRKGELPWDREKVFVSVSAPFESLGIEDFLPDSLALTVTQGDMILSAEKPGKFGILLPPLRQRAVEAGVDYWDVENLVIQVADLEELLQMSVFIA